MNNNQSGSRREKGADEDWLRDLRISIHGAPRLAPEPWPVRIDDPFAGRVIDGIANPHMGIIPKAESLRKFKEGMGEVVEKLAEIADNFGKPDSQRVELPDRIITPYIRHAALEALKHLNEVGHVVNGTPAGGDPESGVRFAVPSVPMAALAFPDVLPKLSC